MSYTYLPRQLLKWPAEARAAALWERAETMERSANYWKHRAESAEARMLAHNCTEEA